MSLDCFIFFLLIVALLHLLFKCTDGIAAWLMRTHTYIYTRRDTSAPTRCRYQKCLSISSLAQQPRHTHTHSLTQDNHNICLYDRRLVYFSLPAVSLLVFFVLYLQLCCVASPSLSPLPSTPHAADQLLVAGTKTSAAMDTCSTVARMCDPAWQ
jgi:hypothetical protein